MAKLVKYHVLNPTKFWHFDSRRWQNDKSVIMSATTILEL